MKDRIIEERPGLHFEHLRHLARLRQLRGWFGWLAIIAAVTFYQLHRREPALFEASDAQAMHTPRAMGAGQAALCLMGPH